MPPRRDNAAQTPAQTQARALLQAGRAAEAKPLLERALKRHPRDPETLRLGAMAFVLTGDHQRAAVLLERLAGLTPGDPAVLASLAESLLRLDRPADAERVARRLIALGPPGAPGAGKLAATMLSHARHACALELGDWAHAQSPGDARTAGYAAAARIFAGDHAGAAEMLRATAEARAADPDLQRDPLLLMLYCPQFTREEVFAAHARYGELMARAAPPAPSPPRDPDAAARGDRPLRVAYISQDFRNRSAGHFIEGIVARHDRARVEPFCYSHRLAHDELTDRVRAAASGFAEIQGAPDAAVDQRIRADRIDLAVDLTGHTGLNRLGVLARKPAPVQATYMGYAATTGLGAIDYRLVDTHTDPAPEADALATEELVRLDPCFLCYTPPAHAPGVGPCPAERAGHLTFASFNTFAKVTDEAIGAWAAILGAVPGSRLLVKNAAMKDAWLAERFADRFARAGGDPARLETMGETPTAAAHMALYGRVDIALDTFPYNGTTTTLEAAWMGVPAVTVEGDAHVSRVGVSLLRNLGLDDLIGAGVDGYVRSAVSLAGDADRRRALRDDLRGRVRARLCDFDAFVPTLEDAYRGMWARATAGRG
jgi:protein O-GlcNAc transferase